MHVHLDPLGGLSGDMFVAALLDAFPEHWPHVQSTIASLKLGEEGECKLAPHRDHSFAGRRFLVGTDRTALDLPEGREPARRQRDSSHSHEASRHHEHFHAHESRRGHKAWADIRAELGRSGLDDDVKKHALAIFNLLAEAEAKVHGVAVDSVTFHEVGAVDSIVDIVAAAQLISLIRADRWTSAPLPIGSGRINSAHGVLPIPAPAAALLPARPASYRRRRSRRARHTDRRSPRRLPYRLPHDVEPTHSPDVSQRHRIRRSNLAGYQQLLAGVGVR